MSHGIITNLNPIWTSNMSIITKKIDKFKYGIIYFLFIFISIIK